MRQIHDLVDCINRHDVISFLECYLLLIKDKHTLSLPSGTSIEQVKEEWQDMVPVVCQANDSFYKDLAELWIALSLRVASLEVTESEDSISILVSQLRIQDGWGMGSSKAISPTSVSISSSYHTIQEMPSNIEDPAALVTALHQAVKDGDVRQFLIQYCYLSLSEPAYQLPQTSVLDSIQNQWKDICQQRLIKVSSMFMQDLSKLYFNLSQGIGLPFNEDTIKRYIVSLNAK